MESSYGGFRDLIVYKKSYQLSINVFQQTKSFPIEEKYSLTDQIRRSSRSIVANIAESWPKRKYPKHFVSKLTDALSEEAETEVWLDMAENLNYISIENHNKLITQCDEIRKMLIVMINNPQKFCN